MKEKIKKISINKLCQEKVKTVHYKNGAKK